MHRRAAVLLSACVGLWLLSWQAGAKATPDGLSRAPTPGLGSGVLAAGVGGRILLHRGEQSAVVNMSEGAEAIFLICGR